MTIDVDLQSIAKSLASDKGRALVSQSTGPGIAFRRVLVHLASDPSDESTFGILTDLFSQRFAGVEGFVPLLACLVDSKVPTFGVKRDAPNPIGADELGRQFSGYVDGLKLSDPDSSGGVLRLDSFDARELPKIVQNPQRTLDALVVLVDLRSTKEHDRDVVREYSMYIAFACDLASATGNYFGFLSVVRLVACALAAHGQPQSARDIRVSMQNWAAEGRAASVRRQAWRSSADVFLRLGRPLEAVLSWLIANGLRDALLSADECVAEAMIAARICRDALLEDEALRFAQTLRDMIDGGHVSASELSRYRAFEATIRFQRLVRRPDRAKHQIALEAESVAILLLVNLSVVHLSSEHLPAAILLAQLIRFLRMRDIEIPSHWSLGFIASLSYFGELTVGRVAALSLQYPSFGYVNGLVEGLSKARSTSELGSDSVELRLMAGRFLDCPEAQRDEIEFLLEVLMSHGIPLAAAVQSPEFSIQGLPAQANGFWSLGTAASRMVLSQVQVSRGMQLSAGMSESGALLVVRRMGGVVVLDRHANFETGFRDWTGSGMPARIGLEGFRESREGIREALSIFDRWVFSSAESYVFFLTSELAGIPVQLLSGSRGMIGEHSVIATAPSRIWLDDSRRRNDSARKGTAAWVAGDAPDGTPLGRLFALMDAQGEAHSFDAVRGYSVPTGERRLLILGAHGVIRRGGLLSVADEKGRELPLPTVAELVGSTDVVVLLVCGGGLQGHDHRSHETIGLPFELLSQGVRSVVGSHWNLDVSAVEAWLPHFLEFWGRGFSSGEAVLAANQRLIASQRFKGIADSLAMTVFGDPDVCC